MATPAIELWLNSRALTVATWGGGEGCEVVATAFRAGSDLIALFSEISHLQLDGRPSTPLLTTEDQLQLTSLWSHIEIHSPELGLKTTSTIH